MHLKVEIKSFISKRPDLCRLILVSIVIIFAAHQLIWDFPYETGVIDAFTTIAIRTMNTGSNVRVLSSNIKFVDRTGVYSL
jgi:hypothetical protein